jgi:hypothetical protein
MYVKVKRPRDENSGPFYFRKRLDNFYFDYDDCSEIDSVKIQA